MPKLFCRPAVFLAFLAVFMLLGGCAPSSNPTVLFSLDGPPFAVAGEQMSLEENMGKPTAIPFTGQMSRDCMLAQGEMHLESDSVQCAGQLKGRLNEAGHIQGAIPCNNGEMLLLTFRSLGPDQGIGLANFVNQSGDKTGEALIFYFHPWDQEARRRLDQEKTTLRNIISQRDKE